MPKKKTAPPNAFFFFMQEYRNKHNIKSNAEAATAASPHWNKLSKEQKKKYEDQAKLARQNGPAKMTSEGHDVENLVTTKKEEAMMNLEMKDEISHLLAVACQVGDVHQKQFFFIHINVLIPEILNEVYLPSEIAVSVFTLQDGVQAVFHRIIEPGAVPLGYVSKAKLFSDSSHQMYEPAASVDHVNIREVYIDFISFLKEHHSGPEEFPIIYVDDSILGRVKHILGKWTDHFGDPFIFKVYSMQHLLRTLKNACNGAQVWFSDTPSVNAIHKDVYCFTTGICCKFHEQTEAIYHCSRSVVVRYAYLVCDTCCGDLNIPLIPGYHIPDKCKVPSKAPSSISSFSSRASSSRSDTSSISSYVDSVRGDSDDESICTTSTYTDRTSDDGFQVKTSRRKNNPTSGYSKRAPAFPSRFRQPPTFTETASSNRSTSSTSCSESSTSTSMRQTRNDSVTEAWVASTSRISTDITDEFPTLGARGTARAVRGRAGYASALRGKRT